MYQVIIQSAVLITLGVGWRLVRPQGLDADSVRRVLTGLVYALLLPALVLTVLWDAPLGLDAVRVAVSALAGLAFALGAAWLWYRGRHPGAVTGALLLAATFPNATYMGLPVLESVFGSWSRSVAIQYDLFACTPVLLTVGIYIAAHYGRSSEARQHPVRALLAVPPLWAAVAGVGLNLAGVPQPELLAGVLDMLGGTVVPLMLFAIGLGLRWEGGWLHRLPVIAPVVLLQLIVTPLFVWGAAGVLGLQGEMLSAVVLEAAMPSMVLGIVLCDRYRLESALYALSVTVTTAVSLLTLPLWFELLAT